MANKKHPLEVFTYHSGGRGGIRTLGTFYRTPVFKTGTFNHSVTLPIVSLNSGGGGEIRTPATDLSVLTI